MVKNPERLIDDFREAAFKSGLEYAYSTITHEPQPAPHEPHPLPKGKCAVYVFSLSASYGRRCLAGGHRALKVGRAGPRSNPRFQFQHYTPRAAQSSLAKSLINGVILWPYLGIRKLRDIRVGRWIKQNTDRDNFYVDAAEAEALPELERFFRGRLGPVFEG